MKKLLLSSIIMLGVCGIASAQTDSKLAKQKQAATTSSAASTPQKAAIMSASDAAPVAVAPATSDDVQATRSQTQTARKAEATKVNAAGEVVPNTDVQRKQAKIDAAKAANAPKGKQQ